MSLNDYDSSFHDVDLGNDLLVLERGAPSQSVTQLRRNLLDKVRDALTDLADQTSSVEDTKAHIEAAFSSQIQQCMTGGEDPTILHWLAKKIKLDSIQASDQTFKAARFLAWIATSMDPAMLSTQDTDSKSTPIHLFAAYADSARKGVEDIILKMCRAAEQQSAAGRGNHASKAISSQNKEGKNCLHVAVEKALEITEELIHISSADAVLAARDGGNTPLHEAVRLNLVDYTEQACNNRNASSEMCASCADETRKMATKLRHILGLVAALITKQPKALMSKNDQDQSPYLLHQQSRKQTARQHAGPNRARNVAKDKDGTVPQPEAAVVDKDETISNAGSKNGSMCERVPSGALDKKIEKFLVESAFALGGFEEACQCFFGKTSHSQGLHTIFRLERPLTRFDSQEMYSFFRCGTTLAQVDLSIDPMGLTDRKIKGATVEINPLLLEDARTALANVFVMLKQKKVKRILKLKVRDNQQVPCSDEFIEACLKDFDIRYLDWNKPNLCTDVIIAGAPRAAEVWLYATGSTAVLRSWAGSNGLANLGQLRVLHLYTEMGLEKHPRHMLDVAGFEEDLRSNVEITRKLKIIGEKEKRNAHEIIERQRAVLEMESYLSQLHRKEAENKNSNPTDENANSKKRWFENYKMAFTRELEQRKGKLKREEESPPKFRAGKTALLDRREKHLDRIVSRIREQISQPQAYTTLKVSPPTPAPNSNIDLSDLIAWGVPRPSAPAFDVDFVALDFTIQRTTPEPSTKAGGKLLMKKIRKDDETSFKQHRWVESLRKFVSTYVQGDSRHTRVKVALIDDGVDADLDDLRAMVKGGWPTEGPTSSGTPFYQSTDGHGTAMARLIATACPHIDLYVAKLKSLNKVISRNETWQLAADENSDAWTSAADEAALAIEWARKQGVNIISMSWNLIETEQNSQQINRLKDQISEATRENIIMYCAAADQGLYGSLKKLHPAGSDATIRVVGSATETGHNSGFVHQDQVNYLFPGEEFEEIGNRKGSSAATALAAGFTALVLWCYEASDRNAKSKERNRMRNPERMHYLFEGLQSLLNMSGPKSNKVQSKWVDASMLLDKRGASEGIDAVVDAVDFEVKRREKGGSRG